LARLMAQHMMESEINVKRIANGPA